MRAHRRNIHRYRSLLQVPVLILLSMVVFTSYARDAYRSSGAFDIQR